MREKKEFKMETINISYYKKHGFDLILGSYQNKLCLVGFMQSKNRQKQDKKLQRDLQAQFMEYEDEVLKQTKKELDEYFTQKRKEFSVPLVMSGTEFQKNVFKALQQIPYGETSTYKKQAIMVGNEKGVRAVANANGANPISIIVPCHRIIGSDGTLTGFGGGLELKQKLLDIEKGV
jgi:methylated-DNA-[protein]-cysteine S-methyltransferase